MIVSGGQQRDSTIYIHVSILPQTPLPSRLPITLNGAPCAIHSRSLLLSHFKHSSVYMLMPNALTIPPSHPPHTLTINSPDDPHNNLITGRSSLSIIYRHECRGSEILRGHRAGKLGCEPGWSGCRTWACPWRPMLVVVTKASLSCLGAVLIAEPVGSWL